MSKTLKSRVVCIAAFMVLNFIYGALVIAGEVSPSESLVYGIVGLLWAFKLRKARHRESR